jgi:hypothetical protein
MYRTLKLNYLRHTEINRNLTASESQSKRDFFHIILVVVINVLWIDFIIAFIFNYKSFWLLPLRDRRSFSLSLEQ